MNKRTPTILECQLASAISWLKGVSFLVLFNICLPTFLNAQTCTVSHWRMDEGSGTIISDNFGNVADATIVDATWTTRPSGDDALFFDGTGDYVDLGNDLDLQTDGDMTIAMWLRPTDFTVRRNPWGKAYGGEGTITQETGGNLHFYWGSAGGNAAPYAAFNSVSTLAINTWTHVAFTREYSGGTATVTWYFDGVQVNQTTSTQAASTSSLSAFIGSGYANDYAGDIDHVALYDCALSASDILALYNDDEICDNGVDDDGDGNIDCADGECTISGNTRIAAGVDDAEENTSGVVDLGSSDLELTDDSAYNGIDQTIGLRFTNVNIPQGATIQSAYIEFYADESQTEATNLVLHAEAADNATFFAATANDITNRTTTTASVSWSIIPSWTSGNTYNSVDISPIIQEVIGRLGWTTNNDLVVIISGTGHRTADSYNGNSAGAPNLVFTYCEAGIENCSNGIDDDGDGLVDCLDGDCTYLNNQSADVPKTISSSSATTITSDLTIGSSGTISDLNLVNLDIAHAYINDLIVSLTSPSSTTVILLNQPCGSEDNINMILDDEGTATYPCPPSNGLAYQPDNPLTAFNGEEMNGTWTLTIQDVYGPADGGSLNGWGLEMDFTCQNTQNFTCGAGILSNPEFESGSTGWTFDTNVSISTDANTGVNAAYANGGVGGVYQNLAASAGDVHTLSAYGKKNASENVSITLKYFDASFNTLHQKIKFITSSSYENIEVAATAPAETAWVQALGWKESGSGQAWWDSFCLENWSLTNPTCANSSCPMIPLAEDFIIPLDFSLTFNQWIDYDNSDIMLCDLGNGRLKLEGNMINGQDADWDSGTGVPCGVNDGWYVDITLFDRQTWSEYQGTYAEHASCANSYLNLDYWDLTGTLTGIGCNAGRTLNVNGPSPGYRLQIGIGGNNQDASCSFGVSTWLEIYEGGSQVLSDIYSSIDATCYQNLIPPDEEHFLEMECGTVGSLWNIITDVTASNDTYTTIAAGNNSTSSAPTAASDRISLDFTVAEANDYNIFGRVNISSASNNSFWYRMDGGTWINWNGLPITSGWEWQQFTDYNDGGNILYNLSVGNHTLDIAYREEGALIDKIYISSTAIAPSGTGSAAGNCAAEICDNNLDDDGDGLTDCADPDCSTVPACIFDPDVCWMISDGLGDGHSIEDTLYTFNHTNGNVTAVGPTGVYNIESMALDLGNNIIYATSGDTFGIVNPTTGAFTAISTEVGDADGANGLVDIDDIDGMTFDATNNVIWASERLGSGDGAPNDYLLQINPATGKFVPDAFGVGIDYVEVVTSEQDIDDLVIAADGTLFAISNFGGSGNQRLGTINKTTGVFTEIGDYGIEDVEGLMITIPGQLLVTTGESGDHANSLYSIDAGTATSTFIGSISPSFDTEACACMSGDYSNLQIGDFVWADLDSDGLQDIGEPGVDAVVVNLLDGSGNPVLDGSSNPITTTTDSYGYYIFDELVAGSYIVEFVLPSGTTFSPSKVGADNSIDSDANTATGRTAVITLAGSTNYYHADAGIINANVTTRDCTNSGELFVADDGGNIKRYNQNTGAFIDDFIVTGLVEPRELLVGPNDEYLYVSLEGPAEIRRYSLITGTLIDVLATGIDEANGMTFGSDDHLYVNARGDDKVVKVNTSTGVVTDFIATGTSGLDANYGGIEFGPDGNLYTTNKYTDQVLRWNGTTGAFIDTFVLSTASDINGPEDLLFGPDGNLYVLGTYNDKVVRFNGTTGAYIDDFVTYQSGGLEDPHHLTFGDDGNLYVSSTVSTIGVLKYNGVNGVFISNAAAAPIPRGIIFAPVESGCPEICDNDFDDDMDGLVDCEDTDCDSDPACDNCTITVRALGSCGGEQIYLKVDGKVVATYTLTTSYANYTYSNYDEDGVIAVEFIDGNNGCDLNARIDYIDVNGNVFQSETDGYHTNTGCNSGEWLNCSGSIYYGQINCMGEICPAGSMVAVNVSANSDDAEQSAGGTMDLGSSDLELVYDGSNQYVGIRFQSVAIPQGAIITNAYVVFTTDETNSDVTNLTFHAEDIDDSPTFTTTANNISSRTTTSSSVFWPTVPSWDQLGEEHDSPNLASIIQEVVDRTGWVSGADLSIIISGTGERVAHSYNNGSGVPPKLVVEFCGAEICDNGIDDDGDGLTDCADPDCSSLPVCATCNLFPGSIDNPTISCPTYDPSIINELTSPTVDCEEITNGEFDNGTTDWYFYPHPGSAVATLSVDNTSQLSGTNSAYIDITSATGGSDWQIELGHEGHSLTSGATYTISFEAKAVTNRTIGVALQLRASPWSVHWNTTINLTTSGQTFTLTGIDPGVTGSNMGLMFWLGTTADNVYIDNVSFFEEGCGNPTFEYQWQKRESDGFGGWNAWTDISGATGTTYDPPAISATTQFRRRENVNGCVTYVYTNIVEAPFLDDPVANAGNDQSICLGESVSLSASASGGSSPYTYDWSHGLGQGSAKSPSPVVTTIYTVTVTDDNGCTDTDEVTVTVNDVRPGIIGQPYVDCPSFNPGLISSEVDAHLQCNVITNEEFDNGTTDWSLYVPTGNSATMSIDNSSQLSGTNSTFIDITSTNGNPGDTELMQTGVSIINGDDYNITFDAKVASAKTIVVGLQLNASPWTTYLWESIDIVPGTTSYSIDNVVPTATESDMRLVFKVGATTENIYIDNVAFNEVCGSPTVTYIWEKRIADGSGGWLAWTTISGATGATYDPPVQTIATQYRRLAQMNGCGNSVISNTIEVSECPATWQCDSKFYQTIELSGDYWLYEIITKPTVSISPIFDLNAAGVIDGINSTVFNKADGYIYTLNMHSPYRLYRIGSDQTVQHIGNVAGFNQGAFVNAAEIVNGNILYRSTDAADYYELDMSTMTVTLKCAFSELPGQENNIGDYAYNPINGKLYGTRDSTSILVEFDPVACTQTEITTDTWFDGANGAFFISADGVGYGYENFTGKLQRINLTTGAVDLVGQGATTEQTDGCSCEGIKFTKEVSPDPVNECQMVTYTFTIYNNWTQALTNVDHRDTLTDGLLWASEPYNLIGGVTIGSTSINGTDKADFVISSIPQGTVSFQIDASIPQGYAGATPYMNQAFLSSFPALLLDTKASDDPSTAAIDDETPLTIISNPPLASAGSDDDICLGASVTLTATGGGTYEWSTTETTVSISVSPTITTTYTVTVTDGNGCTDSDQVIVTVNPLPSAGATNDGPITCSDPTVTLTATPATGVTYAWSGGGTGQTKDVTVTGTYTVTVTDGNGCTDTAQTIVTDDLIAPTANAGADDDVCLGDSKTLTATGGGTYAWSTGGNTASVSVSPATTTTYTVTVTAANGCTDSDEVVVTVNPLPTAGATNDGPITCADPTVTMTATPATGVTYAWSGGGTGQTKDVTATGTYTVTVTDGNGCTATAETTVTIDAVPPTADAGVDQDICIDDNATLTASGGGSYAWSTTETTATITVSPVSTTTYTVTVTATNGCTDTDQVVVTVFDAPTVTVADVTICTNETTTLSATVTGGSGTASYQWQVSPNGDTYSDISGATSATYTTPQLQATTFYQVVVTQSGNACPAVNASATVTVEVESIVLAVNAEPQEICNGESTILTVNDTTDVGGLIDHTVWTVGTGSETGYFRNGVDNENHRIIGDDPWGNPTVVWEARPEAASGSDGGWNGATFAIDHTQLYRVSVWVNRKVLGTDGRFYLGSRGYGSVNGLKRVTNGTTYTNPYFWVSSSTPSSSFNEDEWVLVVGHIFPSNHTGTTSHPESGRYTHSNGNVGNINYDFQWLPETETTLHRSYLYYCTDVSVRQQWAYPRFDLVNGNEPSIDDLLNGYDPNGGLGEGATFEWYTGSCGGTSVGTGKTLTVSPTTTTTYYVRAEGSCNTTACESITVTVNDFTTAAVTNDGPITCADGTVTLTATPAGLTYLWDNAAITETIDVTATGTYSVTITDANGCTDVASSTVTSDLTDPTANAGTDDAVCIGESASLTATGGGTYLWSTTETTATITVTPASTTTYTVTVTATNGCTDTDEVVVTVNPLPTAGATNDGPITCAQGTVTLTATPATGVTYAWSGGGTAQTKDISATGTYTVTVTDGNGCTDTAETTVTIDATPPIADAGVDQDICIGDNATLTATGGGTYIWSTTETTATITVSPAVTTTYTVTVTAANGCTASDEVVLTVNPLPNNAIIKYRDILCSPANGYAYATQVYDAHTYLSNASYVTGSAGCGNQHVQINGTTPAQNIGKNLSAAVSPGFTYNFDFKYKLSGAGYVRAHIYWYNSSWGFLGYETTVLSTTGTWSDATVSGVAPAGAANVQIGLLATAPSVIDYDCLVFEENGGAVVFSESFEITSPYSWSGPNGASSLARGIYVFEAGTYTVTITDPVTGCQVTNSIEMFEDTTPPDGSISNDGPLTCAQPSVILTATSNTAGATFSWSSGGTAATETVNAGGTYTVTITDPSNGCTTVLSTDVIENTTPPTAGATNDGPITCTDPTVTMTATPATGVTYAWSGGGTSQTKDVTVAGTYTVTVTDTNGCTDTAETIVVDDTTPPAADAGADDDICIGASSTLTATGGGTYVWSTTETASSITVSPVSTTTYTVTVTAANGCTATDEVIVTVNPLPNAGATNNGPLTCGTTTVTLTATPATGVTYLWSGGGTSQTKDVTVLGDYTVTVTDVNGCTSSATTSVLQDLTAPNAGATVNRVITCIDVNATLTATPAGKTYAWSGGGTGQTKIVTTGGIYTVTVTDTNGCTDTAKVQVVEDTSGPTVTLTDEEFCASESVTLDPVICENYPDISAQRPLNKNGWVNRFGEDRSPLKADGELCFTLDALNLSSLEMIGLNADPFTSDSYQNIDYAMYIWVRDDLNSFRVYIYESGTNKGYKYISSTSYVGSTFCVRRTGTTIEYLMDGNILYTSLIASNDDLFYDHAIHSSLSGVYAGGYSAFSDIALCGTPELTYDWSTNETTETINVSTPGTYTITVTSANGCTSTAQSVVTENPLPNASASNDGPLTCSKTTVTNTALPANMTYLWSTGATSQTIDVSAPGLYTVTVTDSEGCEATTSTTVIEDITPPIANAGANQQMCSSENIVLTASGGGTYLWSTTATTASITVSPTTTTTYTVTVTAVNGCTDTDQVEVQVNVNPTNPGSITGAESLCGGYDPTEITSTSAASGAEGNAIAYNWQKRDYNCTTSQWSSWADIVGANALDYNPTAISSTTEYRRLAGQTGCPNWLASNVITKEVVNNFTTAGTIAMDQSDCGSFDPNEITGTAATGGCGGSVEYKWQTRPSGGTWTDIAGATAASYNPGIVTTSTEYKRLERLAPCPFIESNVVVMDIYNTAWDNVALGSDLDCDDNCSGSITIDGDYASTGAFTVSYTYQGNVTQVGPFSSEAALSIDNLCDGVYSNITIESVATGCTDVWPTSVTISKSGAEWDHVTHVNDVSDCTGICNGAFVVDANFGFTGDFNISYTFENNVVVLGPYSFAGDIIVNNLCAGTYSDITITAVTSGCSDIWPTNIEIETPTPAANLVSYEDDDCQLSEGSVLLNVTDGTAPYTVEWASIDGTIMGSTTLNSAGNVELDGLTGGFVYCISVTDSNGCSAP